MRTPSANAYKVGQPAKSELESLKRQAVGRAGEVLVGMTTSNLSPKKWVRNIDAQQHEPPSRHLRGFFLAVSGIKCQEEPAHIFFMMERPLPLFEVANLPLVRKSLKETLTCVDSTLRAFLKELRV